MRQGRHESHGEFLWGRSANQFCAMAVGLSAVVAIADALFGHKLILIGLLIVGPCCATLGVRWTRTAIAGIWAVALGVVLSIPDGIWGTFAQVAFVGAVLVVTIVSTLGTAVVEARINRRQGLVRDADAMASF